MSVGFHPIRDHVAKPLAQASAVARLDMCRQDSGVVEYVWSTSSFSVSWKVLIEIQKDSFDIPVVSVRKKSQPNSLIVSHVFILQALESGFRTGGVALTGEKMKGSCEKAFILVTNRDGCRYLGEKDVCLLNGVTLNKGSDEPQL